MDLRGDVQQFLTGMRARLTPEQAGVPMFGGERRVPGLRREEVAQLAGVSTAYYTRMERGDLGGVSESVLFALARGLQLTDAETTHLMDLARTATQTAPRTPHQTRATGPGPHRPAARHDARRASPRPDPARRIGRVQRTRPGPVPAPVSQRRQAGEPRPILVPRPPLA